MTRRLPNLKHLRAFEAAARLGGFSRAADQLCVSPGAVAQHIRTLEAWAGAPLFQRRAQGVELSQIGRQILPSLTTAFDALGLATQTIRSAAAPQRLHIAALPAVAQLWLAPRLAGIRAQVPDLVVSVTALETPPNLTRDPFDLAVFYRADDAGTVLCRDQIFPVCAPHVAAGLAGIADLEQVPCMSDAVWGDDWRNWLTHVAPGTGVVPRGPVFSLFSLAVDEAVNGAGVLMARGALVAQHLEDGRLVRPFPQAVAVAAPLCLSQRPGPVSAQIQSFIKMLGA